MLSLSHTLISLPFAYLLDNPLLVFMSAFVFHLLADTFLHWNLFPDQSKHFFYPLVGVEVALGLVFSSMVVGREVFTLPVLAAIAGGNAPDIIHQLWFLLGTRRQRRWFRWAIPAFNFHDRLQLETSHLGRGLISQGILVALAIILVQTLR